MRTLTYLYCPLHKKRREEEKKGEKGEKERPTRDEGERKNK